MEILKMDDLGTIKTFFVELNILNESSWLGHIILQLQETHKVIVITIIPFLPDHVK